MRIQALPEALSSIIAAGEAIRRPACSVKECLENALDAGATKITLSLEKGGIHLIRIQDNGHGIHHEDLPLAITRYATSKISQPHDLNQIETLGFRGEALASMAAVSRLSITSRTPESECAYTLTIENNKPKIIPAAHPVGTTIQIRELFYNTPARRKFLKTERTELNTITKIAQHVALSRYDFDLIIQHQNHQILNVPKVDSSQTDPLVRIASILGASFAQQAHRIEWATASLELTGWIANPSYTGNSKDKQYLFVNGRAVNDKLIKYAIRQAFNDVLFNGRQPVYVLYLNMPFTDVDVNVHPSKQEILLRDSRMVFSFIHKGISDILKQIKPGQILQPETIEPEPILTPEAINTDQPIANQAAVMTKSAPVLNYPRETKVTAQSATSLIPARQKTMQSAAMPTQAHPATPTRAPDVIKPITPELDLKHGSINTNRKLGVALCQIHDIYIVAQNKEGMVLIDMHAAHERVLYEQYKRQFFEKNIETQQLLIPHEIALSADDEQLITDKQSALKAIGFDTEVTNHTLRILSKPALLPEKQLTQLIFDTLAELHSHGQSQAVSDTQDIILSTLACHSAVRAHHKLSRPEMQALIDDMEHTPHSGLCNHGRPTTMMLNLKDIDALFLRGQ